MSHYETCREVAMDLNLSEEELQRVLFATCPRKGVSRIDERGHLIPCDVCAMCDEELPWEGEGE